MAYFSFLSKSRIFSKYRELSAIQNRGIEHCIVGKHNYFFRLTTQHRGVVYRGITDDDSIDFIWPSICK